MPEILKFLFPAQSEELQQGLGRAPVSSLDFCMNTYTLVVSGRLDTKMK